MTNLVESNLVSSLLILVLILTTLLLILRKLLHEEDNTMYCYLCRSTQNLRRGLDYKGNVYILCERCRGKILNGLH